MPLPRTRRPDQIYVSFLKEAPAHAGSGMNSRIVRFAIFSRPESKGTQVTPENIDEKMSIDASSFLKTSSTPLSTIDSTTLPTLIILESFLLLFKRRSWGWTRFLRLVLVSIPEDDYHKLPLKFRYCCSKLEISGSIRQDRQLQNWRSPCNHLQLSCGIGQVGVHSGKALSYFL